MILRFFISIFVAWLAGCAPSRKPVATTISKNDTIPATLKWSERMALSILKRNPWMQDTTGAGWGYTQALIYTAFEGLGRPLKPNGFDEIIERYGRQMIASNGTIKGYKKEDFNLDNINGGKILFRLYATTRDERYRMAIEKLRDQLRAQPRTTEGGYWHKQKYPHQMWLDGAYMASPFLARYAYSFNDMAAFDEVTLQLVLMEKYLKDEQTGLLYHGWDEKKQQVWANKQTGRSPNFWGRAIGWYAMALVDALDYYPDTHKGKKELVRILKNLSQSLKQFQDSKTGLWYQVMDAGNRKGNYLEGSASAMFVYALAKAARKGYIDRSYKKIAEKGFTEMIDHLVKVHPDGAIDLLQVCEVAGLSADRDGSYEYYVNEAIRISDPKGTGPFILASIELNR